MNNNSAHDFLKLLQAVQSYVHADRVSTAFGLLPRLAQELSRLDPPGPYPLSPAELYTNELRCHFVQLSYVDTMRNFNKFFPKQAQTNNNITPEHYARHKNNVLRVLSHIEKFARERQAPALVPTSPLGRGQPQTRSEQRDYK